MWKLLQVTVGLQKQDRKQMTVDSMSLGFNT